MKKTIRFLALALVIVLTVGCFPVSAITPYQTFTYSYTGEMQKSPAAYVPYDTIDSFDLGLEGTTKEDEDITLKPLNSPSDLFVDDYQNIYIADGENDRILKIVKENDRYKVKLVIHEFINDQGVPDTLDGCKGLFVKCNSTAEDVANGEAEDGLIYVADTDNYRIVVFDMEGNFVREIGEPKSEAIEEGSLYKPIALSVDDAGRIYVVSSTTYMGVITLRQDGTFLGYIGAQKATVDAFDIIWRYFQTDAQQAASDRYVPTEFNNITIDKDGFIYVTTSSIDEAQQQAAIVGKDTSDKYAPVKKLNLSGIDVMYRTGFYPPSGELNVMNFETQYNTVSGTSKIIDVALGPDGTWSLIDEKRQRIYTYDENGNMLWAFGNTGNQIGTLSSIQCLAYHGTDMIVLDKNTSTLQIFTRTTYGDLLAQALQNQQAREYDEAINDWREVLKMNNNFDLAYIGIGRALLRSEQYEEAMEYFEFAYETENWSDAFQATRKEIIRKYLFVMIIAVIVLILLLVKFMGWVGKVNNKATHKQGRKSKYYEELVYGFYVMVHPFDGFWDLKHEKRGSLRAAFTFVAFTIAVDTFHSLVSGYLFNTEGKGVNILLEIVAVALPLLLWCVGNWCLTTLFDGEGTFKDIFIATSYALLPYPLLLLVSTILSNMVTLQEASMVTMITTIGVVWMGGLILFGSTTTHDYTFGKGVITALGTILAVAVIIFVCVLFSGLIVKIYTFINNIVVEISFRLQ